MKPEIQKLIWLCAGFALGGILGASFPAVRYIPLGIAFGLLCFGCGVFLASFLNWQRRQDQMLKDWKESIIKFGELQKELEEEKRKFEGEKEEFEAEKEVWEIEHGDEPDSPSETADQEERGSD